MPTGPLDRVAGKSLAKKLLGWEPKTMFMDGLHKTIDWHVANRKQSQVSAKLEAALTAR
jgi:dTDP-D-glucose 4,6-dehydratase